VAYATWLGASQVQAADIAQDVLTDMLKTFDNYTHPYAIARIEVRRAYFRLVFDVREEPFDRLEGKGDPLIADPHAFEELEQRYRYLPLLPKLAPKQRIAMILTLDGASPTEIAHELGGDVTVEQVRSNLRNARRKLKDLIEHAEREQEVGE